jgi:hypothetical protein
MWKVGSGFLLPDWLSSKMREIWAKYDNLGRIHPDRGPDPDVSHHQIASRYA